MFQESNKPVCWNCGSSSIKNSECQFCGEFTKVSITPTIASQPVDTKELTMLIDHIWVPFDAEEAGELAVKHGSITIRNNMTPEQIIEKYGDMMSEPELERLKSLIK